jgi:hypothetical protein
MEMFLLWYATVARRVIFLPATVNLHLDSQIAWTLPSASGLAPRPYSYPYAAFLVLRIGFFWDGTWSKFNLGFSSTVVSRVWTRASTRRSWSVSHILWYEQVI